MQETRIGDFASAEKKEWWLLLSISILGEQQLNVRQAHGRAAWAAREFIGAGASRTGIRGRRLAGHSSRR